MQRRASLTLMTFAAGFSNAALACSCMGIDDAGFVHTKAARLPSNAIGALFLPPSRVATTAANFEIRSDAQPGLLPVVLSWPGLARGEDREAAPKLMRVGPAGGFKPGARYTISYIGASGRWAYPESVQHLIDAAPLDTANVHYSLEIGAPAGEKPLLLSTSSGACGDEQPALVQDFHYQLPLSHQPYQDAILFYSEIRSGAAKRYSLTEYSPSLCGADDFASTAYGQGKDMVYAQCGDKPAPSSVRGWAGILEVEDRLHLTEPISVDLGPAVRAACVSIDKKLAAAFASGDAARISDAVCRFADRRDPEFHEESRAFGSQFPTASLLALAASEDAPLQACAAQALVRVFGEAPVMPAAMLSGYVATFKADLLAADPRRVLRATQAMEQFVHRSRSLPDAGKVRSQAVLVPLLDPMIKVLLGEHGHAMGFLPTLIAEVKLPAQRHVPALLAAATVPSRGRSHIVWTLREIAPHDPRVRRLLLESRK
jgi:hypothetical protein